MVLVALGGFAFGGVGGVGALVLLGSGAGGGGLVVLLLLASGGLGCVCCAVCCGGCAQNHLRCLVVSPCMCRLPASHLPD